MGHARHFFLHITDIMQHVVTRKHRKFAATSENWAELDQLLAQLDRR